VDEKIRNGEAFVFVFDNIEIEDDDSELLVIVESKTNTKNAITVNC
jgi:hypothetical protein